MLLSLHIENIAVIKCVDFDFSEGFTVLTGETGAGKSVVIDSINLLLGMKADKELVRSGADFAMVSGLFGELSADTLNRLSELGVTLDEGELLIQRTVNSDGRSKITLNGRSVSLSLLKAISPYLICVHAQSDTASLTEAHNHLELVDVYAKNSELLERYAVTYSTLENVRREIREINEKASESERLKEILRYQIKDIDSLSLRADEEDELLERRLKLKNSEKIAKNSDFVYRALRGSEKGSVAYLIDRSVTALSQISDVVPEYQGYAERLRETLYQVEDIAEEVYAVVSDTAGDPTEMLNKIESRLDKISKIKRKYGLTLKDVLEFRERAAAELLALENSEDVMRELSIKEKAAYSEALVIADEIHQRRLAAAEQLDAKVLQTLEFLDMPKVVFFTSIKSEHEGDKMLLSKDGYDVIEFYISANRGAEPQPLSKIASGGELSRVMLALKSVIADKDGVPTVIYDEIDTGVSGKTARKIGIKLLELSRSTQLFSVTHSAQIASLADRHFLISKCDVGGATETSVRMLDKEGRITELSRILGGIDVTASQRAAAEDMLNEKSEY